MANRGDAVECHCGAVLRLENERVPWHKLPGKSTNCWYSGAFAENWDTVSAITVKGVTFGLECPACGGKTAITNTPKGSKYPLVCGSCGNVGTLQEFADEGLKKLVKPAPTPTRKHRYAG